MAMTLGQRCHGITSWQAGLFACNANWDNSYNLRNYSRPLFGAATGSIGALMYRVLLTIGSTTKVDVRVETFYIVAFVLRFADKAFGEMLETKPVLAKGDNFRPPYDSHEHQRYIREYLTGAPATPQGGGRPSVQFIRQMTN